MEGNASKRNSNSKLKSVLKTVGIVLFFGIGMAVFRYEIENPPSINSTPRYCGREHPYSLSPEFQRANSLIQQRANQAVGSNITPDPKKTIGNCIDIQYSDLTDRNAEGVFLFDENSTSNDLKIYVDKSYEEYDDYLTAILLSHEEIHAYQFVLQKFEGQKLSCFEKEEQAFQGEFDFISDLNTEEKTSLAQRILSNPQKNAAYEGVYQLLLISKKSYDACQASFSNPCYIDHVTKLITNMVETNPFYQQECTSELSPELKR